MSTEISALETILKQELCIIQIMADYEMPNSQVCFEKPFQKYNFE